ncbi:MAG: DMT family transporter [Eubacteriales bacterium]|nr:DMT family transporter [Eubacteriales bacterium]
MKKQTSLKNPLLLLLTATIWGIAFIAQSVGGDQIGDFTFNFVRNLIGCVVLLPVIYFFDHGNTTPAPNESERKKENKTLLLGGLVCGTFLCLASNFQQVGIRYTSVGKAGFITACYIVIVPILGLFLKKKCTPFIWVAVVMALIGLYLLCIKDGFSIGKGDILVFICAILFSLQILAVDHFSPKVNGVKLSCLQFLVCGVFSAIMAFIFETPNIHNILHAWQPVLYAGVMSCGVGYTLQIIAQKGMNPTVASLIMSLESCISVLAGWLLLNQNLSRRELLGCVIMFAAIVLAQLPERK